jgi:universal stress protein A
MFKHILVPTDFSARSKRALEIAVNISRPNEGTIYLLHVIKMIPNTTFAEFEDFYLRLEKQAEQEMATLLLPYDPAQINIEARTVYGNRVQEILRFAEEYGIELIVMNSHKIDPKEPVQGWGTISYKVGALAPCPIMLVK